MDNLDRRAWSNIRGLSILSVILIHITATKIVGTDTDSLINLILNQISRFAVPIFLMSSGYGLQTNYNDLKKSDLGEFYKKRLKIIPGYLFWSCVYYIIGNIGRLNIGNFIYGILTGTTYGHLYFMIVLIIGYLLFPFVHKFASTIKGTLIFLGITLIGQLIYLSGITWGEPYVWNWLFYFILGIFLSSNPIKFNKLLKNGWKICILGIGLVLASSMVSLLVIQREISFVTTAMKPSVIILSIGVLSLSLNQFNKENKFLKLFDSHSLNIYYVHQLLIIVGAKALEIIGLKGNSFIITILLFIIVAIVSLIFSIIFKYSKDKIVKAFGNLNIRFFV